MNNGKMIAIVGVLVLLAWSIRSILKGKPAEAAPDKTEIIKVTSQPTLTSTTEAPPPSDKVWATVPGTIQVSLTPQPLGTATYQKAVTPVPIANTGFSVWGVTSEGSIVVSQHDPSSYAAGQWAFG